MNIYTYIYICIYIYGAFLIPRHKPFIYAKVANAKNQKPHGKQRRV